ncbi:hypothetical protein GCM10028818_49740 [Spirosoma horti]
MPSEGVANSYEFEFVAGEHNTYSFSTYDTIRYEIRFVPSSYMFDSYIEHSVDAYEMVIAVADNPLGRRIPADPLTEPTIRTIFYDFFRTKDQVIIFICDSSDGRQKARARKFTSWFYGDVPPYMLKFDTKLADGERGLIFLSIILDARNSHVKELVDLIQNIHLDMSKEE